VLDEVLGEEARARRDVGVLEVARVVRRRVDDDRSAVPLGGVRPDEADLLRPAVDLAGDLDDLLGKRLERSLPGHPARPEVLAVERVRHLGVRRRGHGKRQRCRH
jgi:hypothetical protein